MTSTELLLNILGGLGLFFVGIKSISRNFNAIASEQFRRRIHNISSSLAASVMFGTATGFVTQSGRVTSFILASLVRGGLITPDRSLPMVLWANLGCTLIAFAAVFPIHLFALFMLGAAGVSIAFERPRPFLNSANAIFGLALMLFGLRMMSTSSSVLLEFSWFLDVIAFIQASLPMAFVLGAVLTVIAQSHIAVILITVAFAGSGIFNFDQAALMIIGTHGGSAIITYITGLHFVGQARQPILAQISYNLTGIAIFAGAFTIAAMLPAGTTAIEAAFAVVSIEPAIQAALVALAFNLVTPLVLTGFQRQLMSVTAKLSPLQPEEELSKPHYLYGAVESSPVTMMMLAEQEQLRLLKRLPHYFAQTRDGTASDEAPSLASFHAAHEEVTIQVHQFHSRMLSQNLTYDDTEWLLNQQNRQELLNNLEGACFELCELIGQALDVKVKQLSAGLVEAIDTVLLTTIAAMETRDDFEFDLIDKFTEDRGSHMENVRKNQLAASGELTVSVRNQILQVTSLFERAAWSLRRFGHLLKDSPDVSI